MDLGGVKGEVGVNIMKIHCMHVWNSQRTKKIVLNSFHEDTKVSEGNQNGVEVKIVD